MSIVPGGYKWALTEIDTYSELGFAYLVLDANAQSNTKCSEQKISHRFGPIHISQIRECTLQPANVQQWAKKCHPQGNGLIENRELEKATTIVD